MKEKSEHVIAIGDGAAIPTSKDKDLFTAWRISFVGAVLLLAGLLVYKPQVYGKALWYLSDGIVITFEVTFASIGFALLIGLFVGLGRVSKVRIVALAASTYVEVIRGIPLLVQLFYIYYGLAQFVKIPPLPSAVIAMSVCYGAYMGEVFRAGIESIDKGQTEASLSLGFSRAQTMFHVVLPQALRTILPPVGNEFIALLKDTSLVSIIAVADLLRRAKEFSSTSFLVFETYTLVAVVYLVITLILSKLVGMMEERLGRHERR